MDLTTNNQMNVDNVSILNSAGVQTVEEYDRNYQILTAGAINIQLDFGHVSSPKYIKIVSDTPIHITMGTLTIQNVTNYEIAGEIQDVFVSNSSTAAECKIDFLVAK